MQKSSHSDLTEEDLELRAAGFALVLGLGALVLLAAAVVIGLTLA